MSPNAVATQLAQRLLKREFDAIREFDDGFRELLEPSHVRMRELLADKFPPGCHADYAQLVPHVAERCGFGYLAKLAAAFDTFLPTLALTDLYTASACLARDDSANSYLLFLVDRRVRPRLRQKFLDRLGGATDEVIDNVASRCWNADGNAADDDSEPSGGAGEVSRLASYYGGCTLLSWLYAVANNSLRDACRGRRSRDRSLEPACSSDEDDSPQRLDPAGASADDHRAQEIADRYFAELRLHVDGYLKDLRAAGQAREKDYQVAYLWIACRMKAMDIADELDVSRPRISQVTKKIREECAARASEILRRIGRDVELAAEQLTPMLQHELADAGTPVLFERLQAAMKELAETRPDLAHVAFLAWNRRRNVEQIARQRRVPTAEVEAQLAELAAWRRRTIAAIADELHAESRLDSGVLSRRVAAAVAEWLGGQAAEPGP